MTTILCISPKLPTFSGGGASARLATVLQHLKSQGHRIHFALASRRRDSLDPSAWSPFADSACSLLPDGSGSAGRNARLNRLLGGATGAWRRRLDQLGARLRGAAIDQATIGELLARHDPDVVWLDNSFIAPLVTGHRHGSRALWICDTIDVLHLRDASFAQAGLAAECGLSRAEEAELLSPFDVVVGIQDREAETLRGMLPLRQRVLTLGHAVEPSAQPTTRASVLFVGSSGRPNAQGIGEFLRWAWPEILAKCPGARLEIVGKVGQSRHVRQFAEPFGDSVRLRGIVPEITIAYNGPAVVVCPIWVGSGLKIKIVEALAFGKATVATPLAAAGLENGMGNAFRMAERPEDFVEPVVELLRSREARRIQEEQALSYAARHFSPATVFAELDGLLAEASASRLAQPESLAG